MSWHSSQKALFKIARKIRFLLYAQHWAESDTQPDPDVRKTVLNQYGQEKLNQIELLLRMIRMGNLLGNTWDFILFKISFGHWGR